MNNRRNQAILVRSLFFCLMLVTLLSWTSSAFAQNNTIFGPNVYVFTTSNSVSSINTTLNTLNANTQFSTNRYAVLFRIQTAKKPETRARKILEFIQMLERHERIHEARSPRRASK